MWNKLAYPWQQALAQAWEAYQNGSFPIGAVLMDGEGGLLSTGRNHINDQEGEPGEIMGNQFAHAETNTLLRAAHYPKSVMHRATLYTTLEPCPQCMGVLYMSGVRQVFVAARDAYAGSTDLLGTSWYLSIKPVRVTLPQDPELEAVILAMTMEAMLRDDGLQPQSPVFLRWEAYAPLAVKLGVELSQNGWLRQMAISGEPIEPVYNALMRQARAAKSA